MLTLMFKDDENVNLLNNELLFWQDFYANSNIS